MQLFNVDANILGIVFNIFFFFFQINLAVQCLSTDFSTQKGVKGMPLHVQIDTYDDPRDPSCPVYHRAYAQVFELSINSENNMYFEFLFTD